MEWNQSVEWNQSGGMGNKISKTGNGHGGLGMGMVDWECRKYNLGHGESEEVVRFVWFHDEMVPCVRNDGILSTTLVGRVLL